MNLVLFSSLSLSSPSALKFLFLLKKRGKDSNINSIDSDFDRLPSFVIRHPMIAPRLLRRGRLLIPSVDFLSIGHRHQTRDWIARIMELEFMGLRDFMTMAQQLWNSRVLHLVWFDWVVMKHEGPGGMQTGMKREEIEGARCLLLIDNAQAHGSLLGYYHIGITQWTVTLFRSFIHWHSYPFILFHPFVYPVCITSMSLGRTIPWTGTSQLQASSTPARNPHVQFVFVFVWSHSIHYIQYTHLRLPAERSLSFCHYHPFASRLRGGSWPRVIFISLVAYK